MGHAQTTELPTSGELGKESCYWMAEGTQLGGHGFAKWDERVARGHSYLVVHY